MYRLPILVPSTLRDPELAVCLLNWSLHQLSIDAACEFLVCAYAGALSRHALWRWHWTLVNLLFARPSADPLASQLSTGLRQGGWIDLAQAMAPGGHAKEEVHPGDQPQIGVPTVGASKTMARFRDRRRCIQLLNTNCPEVMRILLQNPSLTEQDVLRVAAARSTPSPILREIAASSRWALIPRIRFTLLRNPGLPLPLGLRILPLLSGQELKELQRASDLHPTLLHAAYRLGEVVIVH
ncbi:MAG: hypothetical protein NZM37_11005 [Sandaracinaceae bacterium]|nr:hypothetical protein [Sandaracinaceae bacterium]MDW8246669.1 hypothetical protein [Sandaracinaceae bacterium]